jgi:uncharacterized protein with ParB-like and HNH nuclease domain
MSDDLTAPENYQLNVEYYGADFPVELLVKRMEEGDFIIPGFQRKYVWDPIEASRFIESLLIGFPTPALFLAKDRFSKKYIVIDGQQRLNTLQYFYKEEFPDGRTFKLKGVTSSLEGLTYSTLSPSERRSLSNAIIHCIIISENYDPEGMFHIFERLNTTGNPLTPQEVRNAIYHGPFSELLKELSEHETWRQLYGKDDNRGEGQELILRFLSLHFNFDNYGGRMVDFLNQFMFENKNLKRISESEIRDVFLSSVEFLNHCIGNDVFLHKKHFNKILFDSVMLLTAKELRRELDCKRFKKFYDLLTNDVKFWSMSRQATTSRKNISTRLEYVEELYKNTH